MQIKLKTFFNTYIYFCLFILLSARFVDVLGFQNLKVIRFLVPILSIPFFLYYYDKNVSKILFIPLLIIYTIHLIKSPIAINLANSEFSYRHLANAIFLISPLLIAWAISNYANQHQLLKYLKFLFYGFCLVYGLELIVQGVQINDFSPNQIIQSIVSSESNTESDTSLVFVFFAIFFLSVKDYPKFLIASILTILAMKRIAIGGLILGLLLTFLIPKNIGIRFKKATIILGIIFIILIIYFFHLLTSGEFSQTIYEHTGFTVNKIMMGRYARFRLIFPNLEFRPLLGIGVGEVENILKYKLRIDRPLHNDIIKVFYEFGLFLYLIFLYYFFRAFTIHRYSIAIVFLLFFLMMTDNVFNYLRIMNLVYLTGAFYIKNQIEVSKVETDKISIIR